MVVDNMSHPTKKTDFPQFGHIWRNEHVYGEVEAFDIGAIEDWFKRCLNEAPDVDEWDVKKHPYGFIEFYRLWKEAWFSQFYLSSLTKTKDDLKLGDTKEEEIKEQ